MKMDIHQNHASGFKVRNNLIVSFAFNAISNGKTDRI
jgi:hypothetical protein